MNIENYPILETFKIYNSDFNNSQFIDLPSNSDFGNLSIGYMQIVVRLDCINEKIIELYNDFYISKKEKELNVFSEKTLNQGYKQIMIIEEIFYFLKKTADELISIISILTYFKTNSKYPIKVEISSIGNLLYEMKQNRNPLNGLFDYYINLFETLNNIHNAYKHSILNSQIFAYKGAEYPVAFAYYLEHNDLNKKPMFYNVEITTFLNDFKMFLEFTDNHIKSNFEIK